MATIQDDPALLRLMTEDARQAKACWLPGAYWQPYAERVRYWIERDGLKNFRRHEGIGKGYADTYTHDPDRLMAPESRTRRLRHLYDRLAPFFASKIRRPFESVVNAHIARIVELERQVYDLRDRGLMESYAHRFSALDTMTGDPESFLEVGGKPVSSAYLECARRVMHFESDVPFSMINSFLEIGGGFGSQTHFLLSAFPNIETAFYIDIPPILYVGTQYLKAHFGERVMDYAEAKRTVENGTFQPRGRIVAVPPWMLERFSHPVDLAWNANSFQEMDPVNLNGYLAWIRNNRSGPQARLAMILYPHETGSLTSEAFAELLQAAGFSAKELLPDANHYRYFLA